MLTDETILEYYAYNTTNPVDFARAIIAAHEAKRAMPKEWAKQAAQLAFDYAESYSTHNDHFTGQTEDDCRSARNALLAHIGQPPAGKVLVPEEPTEAMKRALFINLAKADDEAFVIKAIITAAQKGKQ